VGVEGVLSATAEAVAVSRARVRRHLSGIRLILPLVVLGLAATLLCGFAGFTIARQSDAVGLENQRAMVRAGLLEFRSAYGESDRVDPRLVEMVAQFSGLSELKFETDPATNDDISEPVLTTQGRIAGFLTWPRETPLTSFMLRLSPLVGAIVIGLIGFAGVSARELHRARAQLALSEKQARDAVEHDALTGLYGHDKMMILLDAALSAQNEQGVVTYALLALRGVDVLIENSGQSASNEVIAAAATNLREALPSGAICGRAGAHEFAMMWTGLDDPQAVLRAAIEALTKPHWIENVVHVAAHAGYAQAPRDARSREDLARRAERALRVAGKKGPGTIVAFDHDIDIAAAEEQFIRRELPRVLAAQALDVHYQPVAAANGSGIVGVEALLRWTHSARGPVSPARFVPVAEQMDLIGEIGAFVLRRALAQARQWPDLYIAVNLSPLQVRDRGIVDLVRGALDESGVAPSRLVLEITEGVLIDNPNEVRKRIQDLRAIGVRIALDDFGSGYSSLGYLQRFPFDKLKIDRSFVDALGRSSNAGVIVQAIVALGRALDVTVVAEGVETDEQRVLLRLAGCDEMQGFLLARPAPAAQIDKLLAAARPAKFAAA
jgi:predicted signal transduction protein with EAL and GGDEF domain